MSSVESIICYSHKGLAGKELEKVELVEDCGMKGDCHAIGGDRQITILSKTTKEWMNLQKADGFCFNRFRENLVIEGIEFETLSDYTKLKINEAILELSDVHKKCYPQLCKLGRTEDICVLQSGIKFAKVISSGIIQNGDSVIILK